MKDYSAVASELQRFVDEGHISGAYVSIWEEGSTVLSEGVGVIDASAGTPQPVTDRSMYLLASMTKPISTVAALSLVEEGGLSLDDTVAVYLPEFDRDDKRDIRVSNILNHTCGIGMVGFPGMPAALFMCDRNDRLADRVPKFAQLEPDFPVGTAAGYSPQVGFDVLGRVMEVVCGKELDAIIAERVLEPLDMSDTTFVPRGDQLSRKAAVFHDASYVPPVPVPAEFGQLMLDGADGSIAGYYSAAAGLWGTAADYQRFARMLLGEGELEGVRVISAESVRLMRTPSNDFQMKPDVRWGLGVEVFGNPAKSGIMVNPGSFGWSGAYGTHFFVDPAAERIVILMTSSDSLGGSESYISRAIEKAVFEA